MSNLIQLQFKFGTPEDECAFLKFISTNYIILFITQEIKKCALAILGHERFNKYTKQRKKSKISFK